MTKGSPGKLIFKFAAVAFMSLFIQKLYGIVDGVVLGRLVGDIAYTAVGSTYLALTLEQTFCTGFCGAISAYIAREIGKGDVDKKSLNQSCLNALACAIFFAFILSVTYTAGAKSILILLRTPDELFSDAYVYLFINGLRIPIEMVFCYATCISQAVGDSKLPSKFMISSVILNVALDVLLVGPFSMGVVGAAVATVLATLISCVLLVHRVWRKHSEVVPHGELDLSECSRITRFCLPMGCQAMFISIGGLFMQIAHNSLGVAYVTAATSGTKIYNLLSCAFVAMGQAVTVYCAQNIGAGEVQRVRRGVSSCMVFVLFYSILSFLVLFFSCDFFTRLFLPEATSEIVNLSRQFTMYTVAFFVPLGAINLYRNAIQGLGYTFLASLNGVFELVGRAFAAFVLVPIYGFSAACLMLPVCWVVACAFTVPAYFVCIKKQNSNMEASLCG